MRAVLIKKHIPLREGIPSVLFDKTIEFIGSLVFLTGGFLLGLVSLRLPATLTIPVIVLQVLGRLLGTVEVIVIMAVLESPVTFIQAIVICAFVTVGNSVFFILPGQWGVTESFHILVLQSMRYPAAVGLSLSVIRRIRNIVFVGLGLALFSLGKRRPAGQEES
jgi:hypothetical protein